MCPRQGHVEPEEQGHWSEYPGFRGSPAPGRTLSMPRPWPKELGPLVLGSKSITRSLFLIPINITRHTLIGYLLMLSAGIPKDKRIEMETGLHLMAFVDMVNHNNVKALNCTYMNEDTQGDSS